MIDFNDKKQQVTARNAIVAHAKACANQILADHDYSEIMGTRVSQQLIALLSHRIKYAGLAVIDFSFTNYQLRKEDKCCNSSSK